MKILFRLVQTEFDGASFGYNIFFFRCNIIPRLKARFLKNTIRHVKLGLTVKSVFLHEYSFYNCKNFMVYTTFGPLSDHIKIRLKFCI